MSIFSSDSWHESKYKYFPKCLFNFIKKKLKLVVFKWHYNDLQNSPWHNLHFQNKSYFPLFIIRSKLHVTLVIREPPDKSAFCLFNTEFLSDLFCLHCYSYSIVVMWGKSWCDVTLISTFSKFWETRVSFCMDYLNHFWVRLKGWCLVCWYLWPWGVRGLS